MALPATMHLRLELVPLLATNLERSKAFYVDQLGFRLDHDIEPGNGMRIIQLTPPGSSCSIAIGLGINEPGSAPVKGLHLVVDDLLAVRRELIARGVAISPISDMGGGVTYAFFSDPDGNSWALQQISRTGA